MIERFARKLNDIVLTGCGSKTGAVLFMVQLRLRLGEDFLKAGYNALGDERVQAANNLIERMYNKVINEPDFVTESELGNRMRAYYARDYAQNVMSELNKLGHEYAISKISEIILNDDEVQKEIADAGITKIADFIEKADMPNVENGKKMKKLADDMNVDNVALTDGDRPLHHGNGIKLPLL